MIVGVGGVAARTLVAGVAGIRITSPFDVRRPKQYTTETNNPQQIPFITLVINTSPEKPKREYGISRISSDSETVFNMRLSGGRVGYTHVILKRTKNIRIKTIEPDGFILCDDVRGIYAYLFYESKI